MSEFDHKYTDQVVCPRCGDEYSDLWELFVHDPNGEMVTVDCSSCDKKFLITRHVFIEYSTEALPLKAHDA
jgi:uncharacterized Zn-finger protein